MVALLCVLGIVGYLGYLVYDQVSPRKSGGAPGWSVGDERIVTAVRARRRVPLAQLPWTLNLKDPEEVLVATGAAPWKAVALPGTGGAAPLKLAEASLPAKFPRRVAVDDPIETVVKSADVPWERVTPGERPVRLYAAVMPTIKRMPDPRKPDAMVVAESRLPWVRSAEAEFVPVSVREAAVPKIPAMIEEATGPEKAAPSKAGSEAHSSAREGAEAR